MSGNRKRLAVGAMLVAGAFATASAHAQTSRGPGVPVRGATMSPNLPQSFGLGSSTWQVHAHSINPIETPTTYTWDGATESRYRTAGTNPWFDASVSLPTGAFIDQVVYELYDNDPVSEMFGIFFVCDGSTAGNPCAPAFFAGTSGTPGWTYLTLPVGVTVDNVNNSYFVEINSGGDTSGLQKFRRAIVYYHLQVSTPPGTATFLDVPLTDEAFQFVEAFVAAGITVGCGNGNYCPDDPVTRRQVAVFFGKALGLFWPN